MEQDEVMTLRLFFPNLLDEIKPVVLKSDMLEAFQWRPKIASSTAKTIKNLDHVLLSRPVRSSIRSVPRSNTKKKPHKPITSDRLKLTLPSPSRSRLVQS